MVFFISAVTACVSGLAIMDREMSKKENSVCLDIVFAVSLAYYFCRGGIMQ